MAVHQMLGALVRARTYITTYGTRGHVAGPLGSKDRADLNQDISALADVLDRRLDRDASFGQNVLLRRDGVDLSVTPAALGMCTVVTGEKIVAADLVLSEDVLVDLNALEIGSIEVFADTISFRHVDGTRIEIVSLPAAVTLQ